MKNRKLKDEILKLHLEGLSTRLIAKSLNCSQSCVRYHTIPGQKEKDFERIYRCRKKNLKVIIYRKLHSFNEKTKQYKNIDRGISKTEKLLYQKVFIFTEGNMEFTVDDVIQKFGINTKCYLTGDNINLLEPKTYHFDHIIPRKHGGTNDLENLGITTSKANFAKRDLLLEEFIDLCRKVLITQGYTISSNPDNKQN